MSTKGNAVVSQNHPARRGQRGQTLVLMALALTALLAASALIIDGGNAFAQQRRTQNGMDASAEAGATQLARRLSGVAISDADVLQAVNVTATANDITVVASAEYTDRTGVVLGVVGGGAIPANAQGVKVVGTRNFSTYIAGVVGMTQWNTTAQATAITGYAEGSGFGGVIPFTLPILLTECESGGGSSKIYFPDDGVTNPPTNPQYGMPWPFGPNNRVALPLCQNGPGNVGWIDWDPPMGGASEVGTSIRTPDNPPISTPHWYYITETGGNTSLDDDMDTWEGKDVLIPIFHAEADNPSTPFNEELIGTCDAIPSNPQTSLSNCATADIGANGQGWYFLVTFGIFHLEHSYIQGSHQADCNDGSLVSPASPPGSGNPVDNCLIGYFKADVVAANMTVGGITQTSEYQPLAIQLID
jgi:Flp pilus assembly protein TadG